MNNTDMICISTSNDCCYILTLACLSISIIRSTHLVSIDFRYICFSSYSLILKWQIVNVREINSPVNTFYKRNQNAFFISSFSYIIYTFINKLQLIINKKRLKKLYFFIYSSLIFIQEKPYQYRKSLQTINTY